MIRLSLVVRRYAPFASFGGGYEGDHRGFSTDLRASARTIAVVEFAVGGGEAPKGFGKSSGSSWIGPWGVRKHPKIGPWMGDIAKEIGRVSVEISEVLPRTNGVSFTMHSAGNMPMKDIAIGTKGGRQGTPDIDTFVDFSATDGGSQLLVTGVMRGDGFPHGEILLVDTNGRVAPLLDYRTASGFTGPFYRLFGAGESNEIARFQQTLPLFGGTFGAGALPAPLVLQES